MTKPDAKHWPSLKEAWDEYGHSVKWEDLFDMKSDRGCYVALAWKEQDGLVNYADLARAGPGEPWEMQNDGHNNMTEKQWKSGRVKDQCDWLEFKYPDGSYHLDPFENVETST